MKPWLPHTTKIAAGLGALALVLFIIWCCFTNPFYGHYQTLWGPGWLISLSILALLCGIPLSFFAAIQRTTGKRVLLVVMFLMLSAPVFLCALFQFIEKGGIIGEFVGDTLQQIIWNIT
jgi:drug/metabolite transporter (DMT)-like permease